MGQEFLEWGAWSDGTPHDSSADRFSGIRTLYRDLIKLRRNGFGATRGLCGQRLHVHHVNNQDKVVGYHRWDSGGPRDDVVVIANFANRGFCSYKVSLPRGGVWRIRLNSDRSGYSPAFANFGSFDLWRTRRREAFFRRPSRTKLQMSPSSRVISDGSTRQIQVGFLESISFEIEQSRLLAARVHSGAIRANSSST